MRVGLTGGIASGKSTVSQILRELGAVIIDADALAREVVAAGTPGFEAVVHEFGSELVGSDGELDRPKLGALVFADDEARKRLEAIVHPLVFQRIIELEEGASEADVVVHDIPLLAESGRVANPDRGGFDVVVVVDVPEEQQVARGIARGMSESDVRDRMAKQATREQRAAIATHLIDNTGSIDALRAQVTALYEQLRP